MKTERRWTVWFPERATFLSGSKNGMAWTSDRKYAERWAKLVGGEVRDATILAKEMNIALRALRVSPFHKPAKNEGM